MKLVWQIWIPSIAYPNIYAAGAKVNFCGEKEQLQPVGAANGFKYLNENFTTIPLTSINRQKKQKTKLM